MANWKAQPSIAKAIREEISLLCREIAQLKTRSAKLGQEISDIDEQIAACAEERNRLTKHLRSFGVKAD